MSVINVNNLTFSYEGSENYIFKDINLNLDNNMHMHISNDNINFDPNINKNNMNIYQDMNKYVRATIIRSLILQFISIKFANAMIELMDLDSKICQNYFKIINGINNNNQNNNYLIANPPKRKGKKNLKNYDEVIANPPKKEEPKEEEGEKINIIYYDENIKENKFGVFDDSILFERVIKKGIFILATGEKRLKLILEEIKRKNNGNYDFHLIVTGSKCKKVMDILGEDEKKLFKSGCIYTENYTKYKKYIKEYNDIIKNVYTEKDEIISFIKKNESSTDVYQSYKLIDYDNYIDK